MKKIIAFIRSGRIEAAKAALGRLEVFCLSVLHVHRYGRDISGSSFVTLRHNRLLRCRSLLRQERVSVRGPAPEARSSRRKRRRNPDTGMLVLFAGDDAVPSVIRALFAAGRYGRRNGGEIYICPMVAALNP
jgi:nitrogen regulatory protein PII